MSRNLPAILLAAGVVLLVGSWLWPIVTSGRGSWSDSDATEYQQAAAALHELTYRYGAAVEQVGQTGASKGAANQFLPNDSKLELDGTDYAEVKVLADRLAQTKERYEGLQGKLKAAQNNRIAAANAMRWAGIVVIVVGALGLLSAKSNTSV